MVKNYLCPIWCSNEYLDVNCAFMELDSQMCKEILRIQSIVKKEGLFSATTNHYCWGLYDIDHETIHSLESPMQVAETKQYLQNLGVEEIKVSHTTYVIVVFSDSICFRAYEKYTGAMTEIQHFPMDIIKEIANENTETHSVTI